MDVVEQIVPGERGIALSQLALSDAVACHATPPELRRSVTSLLLKMSIVAYLERFVSWATTQPDIEGVALVGSYARRTATEDSDVDLMILTTDSTRYLKNHDWLWLFGEVKEFRNETWGCVETVRAIYKSSLEIEYNFSAPSWAGIQVDAGTRRVVNDGMKILFDPMGILDALRKAVRAEDAANNQSSTELN